MATDVRQKVSAMAQQTDSVVATDESYLIEDDGSGAFNSRRVTQQKLKDFFSPGGGLGDVVGPALSTDNALARFNGITGKLIQNSLAILTDAGALTIQALIVATAAVTINTLSYLFPSVRGERGTHLEENGSGTLTWQHGHRVEVLVTEVMTIPVSRQFIHGGRFAVDGELKVDGEFFSV